jgi:hypothetical protein
MKGGYMARIHDAALFSSGEEFFLCDIVEIRERPARKSFLDDEYERGMGRIGKRNGKRRSFYCPTSYRGETKMQIFLLDMPARPIIPLFKR